MVFSSLVFLCLFLPATVLVYDLVPARLRNGVLLAASLIFYGFGEPVYILIMVFSTVFDYCNGLLIHRFRHQKGVCKGILIASLVGNLGILGFFKYTDFAISSINAIAGSRFALLELALPVGISFYTFQTLSYTIDVYRDEVPVQKNILDFATFVCLFPQLVAGPIVRYSHIRKELSQRTVTATGRWEGLVRFCIGLGKKVLIANQMGALWEEISALGTLSALTAWLGVLAFSLQIYFDFSGYSDMALGIGKMFGFTFPENFRYPYQATSITDFWHRWHITLSDWFRVYVYIPLGGNRKGLPRQIGNLLIVWALTGLWHGAGWNFLAWGLLYFVLLAAEKLFLLKHMEKWPGLLCRVYTLFFVALGWVVFACEQLPVFRALAASLFGLGRAADSMSIYYLKTWGIVFAVGILGSTCLPRQWAAAVQKKLSPAVNFCIELGWVVVLLVVCLAFLISDSYNPFLYFRF